MRKRGSNNIGCLYIIFILVLMLHSKAIMTDFSNLENKFKGSEFKIELLEYSSFNKQISPKILYNNQSPISISHNDDFSDNSNITGDGTEFNPYLINNFNISEDGSEDVLIEISNTNVFFQINNFLLLGANQGIRFENVTNGYIKNTTIKDCLYGIMISDSFNTSIIENEIEVERTAIRSYYSNNTICNNNHLEGRNVILYSDSYTLQFENNIIISNNNPSSGKGIDISRSDNVIIQNNSMKRTETGVDIDDVNNSLIRYNNISSGGSGVNIFSSKNCTVIFNNIDNGSSEGIRANYCDKIIISNNLVINQELSSIYTVYSSNVIISSNFAKNKGNGIGIFNSNGNNTINNNYIENITGESGIKLGKSVKNVNISNNTISNNSGYGIYLDGSSSNYLLNNSISMNKQYGIFLNSISTNNTIKWNNLLNNYYGNTSQAIDDGANNTFVFNYWSDWTTPDDDLNNIVDEPYPIDGIANNFDLFPLIKPEIDDTDPFSNNLLNYLPLFALIALLMIGLIGGIEIYSDNSRKQKRKRTIKAISQVNRNSNDFSISKSTSTAGTQNKSVNFSKIDNNPIKNNQKFEIRYFDVNIEKTPFSYVIIGAIIRVFYQILAPPTIRRITSKQVLENPLRIKIMAILKKREFERFDIIKVNLRSGVSILFWHLQVLEDFGLINHKMIQNSHIYWLSGEKVDEYKMLLYSSIRHSKSHQIANYFLQKDEISYAINQISSDLNLNRKNVIYHCNKLAKIGLLNYNEELKSFRIVSGQKKYLTWLFKRNSSKNSS